MISIHTTTWSIQTHSPFVELVFALQHSSISSASVQIERKRERDEKRTKRTKRHDEKTSIEKSKASRVLIACIFMFVKLFMECVVDWCVRTFFFRFISSLFFFPLHLLFFIFFNLITFFFYTTNLVGYLANSFERFFLNS